MSEIFLILFCLVIILIFLGLDHLVGPTTQIAVWLLTSVITTSIVQIILQKSTGDLLEKIPLTFDIKGRKISLSLFFIVTIILKVVFF